MGPLLKEAALFQFGCNGRGKYQDKKQRQSVDSIGNYKEGNKLAKDITTAHQSGFVQLVSR